MLKELLKDPDAAVRKKAGWSLGMLLMRAADSFAGDRDSDKDDEQSDKEARGSGASSGTGIGVGTGSGTLGSGEGKSSNRPKTGSKPKQK